MKNVIIEDCEDCPFVWLYLGTTECCILEDKRVCHTDGEMKLNVHIPEWCPLPTAQQEAVEAQKQLTTAKGLQYE
jgi:hypothetical protein